MFYLIYLRLCLFIFNYHNILEVKNKTLIFFPKLAFMRESTNAVRVPVLVGRP